MDILIKQFKKYIYLLAGLYILNNLLAAIVLMIFPDLLTIHYSDTSTSSFSANYLIVLFEYITNLIIIYQINKDMKQIGPKSIPILIITFFYNTAGILFYFILLFASNYKPTQLKYGNNL